MTPFTERNGPSSPESLGDEALGETRAMGVCSESGYPTFCPSPAVLSLGGKMPHKERRLKTCRCFLREFQSQEEPKSTGDKGEKMEAKESEVRRLRGIDLILPS